MRASLCLAVALAGCSFYPDPPVETPVVDLAPCDSAVMLPTNLANAEPPGPAEPHEATLGADPTPQFVRLHWPSSDPSTSAALLWRTDPDTLASAVEWGPGTKLSNRDEGGSFTFGGDDQFRMHEVRLCNVLQPATTYSYRVGGDGAWSPTYQFTTPGAPRSFDSARVVLSGDSRGAQATWAATVEAAETQDPDLYIFSGDMVDIGVNQVEWDQWFAAGADVFTRKGLVPAHGNHEFLATNYFAQFALPNNEEWFSYDYGPLHIVSLNDTVRDLDDMFTRQVAWLRADLAAASDATWTIVSHHRPIYSACSRHGSDEDLREAWGAVFDEFGVDVVVAGHNHIYERSVRIKGGSESPADGTLYLVSGGAGAPLYEEIDDTWFNAVANPIEHYIMVDFTPTSASFVVRDLSGNVIDEFTLTK